MPEIDINIWAVLLATICSMIIGSIWYSPKAFYTPWMKLVSLNEEKAKMSAGKAMGGMFVGAFITSYVLAHIIGYVQADTFMEGLQTGFWMWVGFVGAITISEMLFAQRPMKLWLINNGYNLLNLLVSGVIIALL